MSQAQDEDETSCCADSCSIPSSSSQTILRIATWDAAAETLSSFVELYHTLHPEAPRIDIQSVPSIQELQNSILIRSQYLMEESTSAAATTALDGYVVPPTLLGILANELVPIPASKTNTTTSYLPLYERLTAVDGQRAAIPLFANHHYPMLLLLYQKDFLKLLNLPPPTTWKEVTDIAKILHNAQWGGQTDDDPIMTLSGLCIGRMSEDACRKQTSVTGRPCHSQSMSYWGSILASMTQSQGSESGWLFDDNDILHRGTLTPLLNGTLERTLEILEEQLSYSNAADDLQNDASYNLERFRQGACAMTFTSADPSLLEFLVLDEKIGYVAMPGSEQIWNRKSKQFNDCTTATCPYGKEVVDGQGMINSNQAPLVGPLDLAMGGILESSKNQIAMREFWEFVETHRWNINNVTNSGQQLSQPQPSLLTYSDLERTRESHPGLEAYANLMETLASDPNVALPLDIPGAFPLISELDSKIYEYLLADNYTADNRRQLMERVQQSWKVRIHQQDSRLHATPSAVLYQRSLQGLIAEEKWTELYIGETFRSIGWTMGGIACLLAVFFAVWVYVNQHARAIRASQPLFLWMICAGAFVMSSAIFPFGIEDDLVSTKGASVACMSSMWLYGVGFVMLVSALYSKIWRINRIFRHAHKIRKVKIERKHIMVPFLSLLGINLVLLLTWTITDPYEWIREEEEADHTRYGFCSSEHYKVYLALLVCTNLLVAFYTLIQVFECRKLSTEYEENVWIGASLVCIVQVWLISLPILQLTGESPSWLYMTKAMIVFFTCVSTLLCIFLPKIGYLRKERMDGAGGPDVLAESGVLEQEEEDELEEVKESSQFQSVFPLIRFGSQHMMENPHKKKKKKKSKRPRAYKRLKTSGVIGIRVMRAGGQHGQDLDRLQRKLTLAEARRHGLQDELESLQEKFEQYIVANHPHGAHLGPHRSMAEASKSSVRSLC